MWVRGEISNFTCAPSGHCYFTLKEANAQVRCTLFRSRAALLEWQPRNGMQVEVRALVTLFEPRGEFQLNVEAIRRAGVGVLYEAFERLKARLAAEGVFDPAGKRAVPRYPRAVGVITSPTAAALHDVLTVLARRMPGIAVIVYPTPVQGSGAGPCIAAAIERASRRGECDVLVLCRGGGSIEDLWAFNEEVVARAIRSSAIPVVAGVGHETDFTIADFAADLRAATPSAAAEAVSPDGRALCARLAETERQLKRLLMRRIERLWQVLDYLGRRLADPRARLHTDMRHVSQLAQRLSLCGVRFLGAGRWALTGLGRRLLGARVQPKRQALAMEQVSLRLRSALHHYLQVRSAALTASGARLGAINPRAVLERGYTIATDQEGRIVRDAATLRLGAALNLQFARGEAQTQVTRIGGADVDRGARAEQQQPRRADDDS